MPFQANVVKVMIASPSDVTQERDAIREIIHEWNSVHAKDRQLVLLPVGWETHSAPEMGDRPQAIINKQILKDCDLLVAVFWTRLGTPTGEAASGTVEEIEEHLKAGKPAMLYFSNADVQPQKLDHEQYQALEEFKKTCFDRGLVEVYDSQDAFKKSFARQLAQMVIDTSTLWGGKEQKTNRGEPAPQETQRRVVDMLSDEAKEMVRVAGNGMGLIYIMRSLSNTTFYDGDRHVFLETNKRREIALWEEAVNELIHHQLVKDRTSKGEIYELTKRGYDIADELKARGHE